MCHLSVHTSACSGMGLSQVERVHRPFIFGMIESSDMAMPVRQLVQGFSQLAKENVMRIAIGLGVLVVVLLATTAQADDEKEKKISVSECPKAVQKTLNKELGDGKLIDVDVRENNGVAIYESEVWFGEREYDLVIREDGTLLNKRLENDGNHEDSDEEDDNDERGDDEDGDEDNSEKEVETSVRLADLPRAVRRTLKREARGGQIEEIEMEVEGDRIVFEAEVEYETKDREIEYEIQIAADGTLLSKILEVDESDDEDDEEDENDGQQEDDEDEDEEDDD
jgi:hypothetical protein